MKADNIRDAQQAMHEESLTPAYTVEIDACTEQQWNLLLQKFTDASIYQSWAYGSIRWGVDNLSHLVLKRNGRVVGLAQTAIKRLPFLKSGIAYVPWGPLWQEQECPLDESTLCRLLRALRNEYAEKRKMLLRIAPHIVFNERYVSIIENDGFSCQKSAHAYATLLLDISPELHDLRKNFAQKWRNQLNKAEKNGLVVEEGTDARLYDVFISLLKEMYDRKNFPVGLDYSEFREIQRNLPESQKMKIMVCWSQNEPVCATICSALGKKGLYLFGATGNRGMNLNGSNLLQWRMIQWLREQGCSLYDLGGINPKINPHVYHFKKGVAGKSGEEIRLIGQYDAYATITGYALSMLFDKVRTARSWVRAVSGRFRGL